MIATFVIFLREGIEASMIVAILLSYLDQTGQRRYFRDVFLGVGAALFLATAGGIVAFITIRAYAGSRVQTIFETVTYLVATFLLTYMTFWMHKHSRNITSELRSKSDLALSGSARFGIGALAFQAVGREGLETAVFTLAIVFATSTKGVLVGGAAGLVVALCVAASVYKLGKRLNLALFFKVVGSLLMIFAAGILADAVENVQQLGWITFLNHPMWDSSSLLHENSALGDIFHTFFGYSSRPTALQVIVYIAYLAITLSAFLVGRRIFSGRQTGGVTTVVATQPEGAKEHTPRGKTADDQQSERSGAHDGIADQPTKRDKDAVLDKTAQESSLKAEMNASWGTSTRPMLFMRFLPSFCFSNSLRFLVTSPP